MSLSSAALRNELINQKITTMSAKAIFQNAKLIREEAETAVVEYQEGTYVMNLAEIQGDIKIAEAELALAEEELNSAKARATDKLAIKRSELAVLRAQVSGLRRVEHRKKSWWTTRRGGQSSS